jgi:hypothetical protein
MNPRKHQGRSLFLTFVCFSYVAILIAVPLANSLGTQSASTGASRAAPQSSIFHQAAERQKAADKKQGEEKK